MTDIQIFNNPEFGSIRTIEQNGEPWFVGKDVAEALGYSNASKALADHVDEQDKLNNESLVSLGQRGGWLINESGLYSLCFSSKLEGAKIQALGHQRGSAQHSQDGQLHDAQAQQGDAGAVPARSAHGAAGTAHHRAGKQHGG